MVSIAVVCLYLLNYAKGLVGIRVPCCWDVSGSVQRSPPRSLRDISHRSRSAWSTTIRPTSLAPADRTAVRYAGGSTRGLQHDLTGNARSPLGFEGLPAVLQWEHLADDGPQFASVDPQGQPRQRPPVGLDHEEDAACSRTPGLLKRGYDGDQHTSRFDDRPGPLPDLPAHQDEDNIDS